MRAEHPGDGCSSRQQDPCARVPSHRLIPCRKIREGMELAHDVVAGPPGTAPLLRTGVRLSARYARALPQAGIGSVWIEDDRGRDIDVVEPLTPETRAKVHRATGEALDAARTAGLKGNAIHEFARFAAVADVYDAVTSKRVYSGAVQPHVGVPR